MDTVDIEENQALSARIIPISEMSFGELLRRKWLGDRAPPDQYLLGKDQKFDGIQRHVGATV